MRNWYLKQCASWFILYWILVGTLLSVTGSDLNLFIGGLGGNGRVDLISIIRWNLLVLPPVSFCVIYQSILKKGIGIFIKIRSGSYKRLYFINISAFFCTNYLYILMPLTWLLINDKAVNSSVVFCISALMLFPLFTFSLSLVCAAVLALTDSVSLSIGAYIIVCGVGPIMIMSCPSYSKFIYTSYGMVYKLERYSENGTNILVGIVLLCIIIILFSLIYYNILKNGS